jgi:hypothetical protein
MLHLVNLGNLYLTYGCNSKLIQQFDNLSKILERNLCQIKPISWINLTVLEALPPLMPTPTKETCVVGIITYNITISPM